MFICQKVLQGAIGAQRAKCNHFGLTDRQMYVLYINIVNFLNWFQGDLSKLIFRCVSSSLAIILSLTDWLTFRISRHRDPIKCYASIGPMDLGAHFFILYLPIYIYHLLNKLNFVRIFRCYLVAKCPKGFYKMENKCIQGCKG